jgi:hypothetical protein
MAVPPLAGNEALQSFLQEVTRPAPVPILKTSAKKSITPKAAEAPSVRRSGRLSAKAQTRGRKTTEELAQEIFCIKLEGGQPNKNEQARDRLTKLFDAPIPQGAMEAIEDLLKIISLDSKAGAPSAKTGRTAPAA